MTPGPRPRSWSRSISTGLARALSALVAVASWAGAAPVAAAPPGRGDVATPKDRGETTVTGHIFEPNELGPPELKALKVPAGFQVNVFAHGLGNARMLAVAPDGTVYVTRRDEGDVMMLKDRGDGQATGPATRVASRPGLHGIALANGKVYLAAPNQVYRADVLADGRFGPLEMIIHDLPDAGQHNTRTIQVGPDGMLYISVGSTCNECLETNPENATLLRASPDGKTRSIFASGLRDTIGWGWQPQTRELWGMDHGMDWMGDDLPPEELNHIEKGKRYGWPHVYADNKLNPHLHPVGGLEPVDWLAKSVPMAMGYTAHAAPMQLAFYDGEQFPAELRGDAFVAMHGSWNRKPASGYEVVRVRFKNGRPVAFDPFVTGFATAKGQLGRPCGVAVSHDGALLFSDDRFGVIYRVSHSGPALRPAAAPAPTRVATATSAVGPGGAAGTTAPLQVPLAIKRPETKTSGTLTVTSPVFREGGAIAATYSEYDQGASFPLSWTSGPEQTRSYALIVEDPDARPPAPNPVIHWVAWNIPAMVTNLREGLPKQDGLTDPRGMRQGPNTSGAIGFRGPRPPAGDPPHHYHVQVFALDRVLDLPVGSTRDELLAAASGHVLAAGELVGVFQRPPQPARP